jgi:hypothetical protein
MNDKYFDELITVTHQFIDQLCWGVAAGEGTGSTVCFNIGRKIPMQKPLSNPYLHPDMRIYDSELGIMIECAWRLEQGSSVICDSGESNSNEGSMIKGLNNLAGRHIKLLSILPPALDMTIEFEDEYLLKVFCDMTDIKKETINYIIFAQDNAVYTVQSRGKIDKTREE